MMVVALPSRVNSTAGRGLIIHDLFCVGYLGRISADKEKVTMLAHCHSESLSMLVGVETLGALKPTRIDLVGVSNSFALGKPRPSLTRELEIKVEWKGGTALVAITVVNRKPFILRKA
ncbi:MAG: hypothetical protein AAGA58_12715 [Verrucomicrobiota bacterium]